MGDLWWMMCISNPLVCWIPECSIPDNRGRLFAVRRNLDIAGTAWSDKCPKLATVFGEGLMIEYRQVG
jgi:hypothetical protein